MGKRFDATKAPLMIVNNTGEDLAMFHSYFVAVANGKELHEDVADLFTARVVHVDGQKRVIVDWA